VGSIEGYARQHMAGGKEQYVVVGILLCFVFTAF